MSLKHLGPGSHQPELHEGKLRLYSMVFCPYAQRPRLVLAAKHIPFETVNINLTNKPDWYLKLNPSGQVPLLQHDDGRVLNESLIIAEYLDNLYTENRLQPTDPYTNAKHKLLVESFSKVITNFYKLLRNTDESGGKDMGEALDLFEGKLETDYFGGNKAAFADYMIWPWLERLEFLQSINKLVLDTNRYPKLIAYIERMKETEAVKQTRLPVELFKKFFDGYLAGKEPDYDCGIQQ